MNPAEIVALDALDLLVVVDNESDTLSSVDKGVPQLPELGRLVARVPHRAPIDGHDGIEPWGHLCLGCHGFSALVTGRRGSEERAVLFDVGPSADVWPRRNGSRCTRWPFLSVVRVVQNERVSDDRAELIRLRRRPTPDAKLSISPRRWA